MAKRNKPEAFDSPRRLKLLELLIRGCSKAEICRHLGLHVAGLDILLQNMAIQGQLELPKPFRAGSPGVIVAAREALDRTKLATACSKPDPKPVAKIRPHDAQLIDDKWEESIQELTAECVDTNMVALRTLREIMENEDARDSDRVAAAAAANKMLGDVLRYTTKSSDAGNGDTHLTVVMPGDC